MCDPDELEQKILTLSFSPNWRFSNGASHGENNVALNAARAQIFYAD